MLKIRFDNLSNLFFYFFLRPLRPFSKRKRFLFLFLSEAFFYYLTEDLCKVVKIDLNSDFFRF